MAKKGGLSDDFLDRNLPGRKKVKPEDIKALHDGDEETPSGTAAPEKPETPAAAAPEKPAAPAAAPEKPAAAEPAKPTAAAPEKPAESTAAPVASAPAKADSGSVPVHVYTDLRAETKTLKEELTKLQTELAEAKKPKVEAKKEPDDPEPDGKTHPIEHEAWLVRDTRRQIGEVRKQLEGIGKSQTERTQAEEQQAARTQFETGIEKLTNSHRTGADPKIWEPIPDIDDRKKFLRELNSNEYQDAGYSKEEADQMAQNDEWRFYISCVQRQVNPIITLSKIATRRGYQTKGAAPAASAPAPKSDKEKIADAKAREDAGKSAGTFPGSPPSAAADDEMTMEKWAKMSIKERRAYKKEHGDPVPKAMGANEAQV